MTRRKANSRTLAYTLIWKMVPFCKQTLGKDLIPFVMINDTRCSSHSKVHCSRVKVTIVGDALSTDIEQIIRHGVGNLGYYLRVEYANTAYTDLLQQYDKLTRLKARVTTTITK